MIQDTGARSRKPGLLILIVGLSLTLGSCGPFGYSIERALDVRLAAEFPLTVGEQLTTGPLMVRTEGPAQLGVSMEVNTDSLQQTSGGADKGGRFNFPLIYTVRTPEGRTLFSEHATVSADVGSGGTEHRQVGAEAGRRIIERRFDRFDPPAGGTISVEALLQPDRRHGAEARHVQLQIYDNVPRHSPWLIGGVAMLLIGALLTIVGIVLLVASRSAGPVPPEQGAGGGSEPQAFARDDDPGARNWAMLCHLSALIGYVGIPFGHIIGPLVVWLVKRNDSPLIDDQGKESLNFQISVLIYSLVSLLLMFVFIGFLLLFALVVFHLVMTIVAAVRAGDGRRYRYPLTLRLIR